MAKFAFFILVGVVSQALYAANAGPTCRKSSTSQIQNSYPDLCMADYKAGKCEEQKNKELNEKKSEASKNQFSEAELKANLQQVEAKYAKCTMAEQEDAAKAKALGCLNGVGKALQEMFLSAPQMLVESMKRADDCQKDIKTKLKSIQETNEILGGNRKLHLVSQNDLTKSEFDQIRRSRNFITKEELSRISCLELEQKIRKHKAQMWDELSPEEKNQALSKINANLPPSLLEQVKQMFAEMGLPSNCLAPKAYWEAVCLGAVEIASLGVGGGLAAFKALRMARLSKLTGKSAKELDAKLAELQNLSRDQRIAKAKAEVEPLSDGEKAKLVQSELGLRKPLEPHEVDAIKKAHLEGSDRGEGYGSYKGDTLREKKRILMQEGGFSEPQADYMINRGIVGGSSPSNGVMTVEKVKAIGDEATKNRLLGEMQSQKASIRNGVVDQPEAQQYFQKAGKSMEEKLAKDPDASSMQRAAKARMANIENYVIDTKMPFPKDRPEIARKYTEFERQVLPTQRKYEEAATSYIRAGKKEDALRVLNNSPVVSGLSNSTGKQNYIQRFMREAEVSRAPASR